MRRAFVQDAPKFCRVDDKGRLAEPMTLVECGIYTLKSRDARLYGFVILNMRSIPSYIGIPFLPPTKISSILDSVVSRLPSYIPNITYTYPALPH
jgi:hypothetical protein